MNDNAYDDAIQARLRQLREDDAVGQLRRRDGLMAALGSEGGALKLDWVEGVARLLADPAALETVEAEARDIRARGIRHIIWAGMGGSVLTVRVLCELGFAGDLAGAAITLHPLDSTDPAALNAIVRTIAAAKQLPLPADPRALLRDVMMVGVAMGMTSEEPITHLTWFIELLDQAGLPPSEHLLVMTLPGSYLDLFAQEHHAPSRPLQLDGGTGTGGRMSAPATRVFLLPAALYLTSLSSDSGGLGAVLHTAWDEYALDEASAQPERHPFVRLAAALSAASDEGACRLLVRMPPGWGVLVSWLEQLLEESLGKGGKGIVVFDDQTLDQSAPAYWREGMLRVHVVTHPIEKIQASGATDERIWTLAQPSLASTDPRRRLAALAAGFLGWQLAMALYGYLHQIQFAGQPAVENYKARARVLQQQSDPLAIVSAWQPAQRDAGLTLLQPAVALASEQSPALAFARALRTARAAGNTLGYLDVTINGEAPANLLSSLSERTFALGNTLLGIPVKLRRAPAAYHSTEQSEMDGPPYLVSLRLVERHSERCLMGNYTNTFLHAQAVSTWQTMMEAQRPCYLLVVEGALAHASEPLVAFFAQVERALLPDA